MSLPLPAPGAPAAPPSPAPALVLAGVTRAHGEDARRVTALADADLVLEPGEFVAVMGPSGSGKSTLLNLAGGLDAPTAGRVLVQGVDLGTLTAAGRAVVRRRSVGYVFQDFNLLPALTAAENVAFPLELDGLSARRARRAALEALAEVGVGDLADRRPEDMSGGQAQRVAIARALVGPRRLLLADEPTGALDSATGTAVLRLLRERADGGAAVLMVTHEARFAAWADRTVFLRDGRIIDETGPSDAADLLGGAAS
ncbi:putative ABC transporter ATP-binding protein YknY [Nocardiopsis dassonvillei]|uniref:ABC transporter ATP-binding protein n=1 Tax=Nocardiopsis dassonvillei TaxID=2014 RepID=UPI003F57E972